MPSTVVVITGSAGAIFSMASFAPQLIKIWKERDASSVSMRMFVLTVVGFSLWAAYGFMLHAWPLLGSNLVCLLLCAAIVHAKWHFRDRSSATKTTRANAETRT